MRLPAGLQWWRDEPGGPDWLASLPDIVERRVEHWSLTLEPAFESAHISLVLPAKLPDGRSVVQCARLLPDIGPS